MTDYEAASIAEMRQMLPLEEVNITTVMAQESTSMLEI